MKWFPWLNEQQKKLTLDIENSDHQSVSDGGKEDEYLIRKVMLDWVHDLIIGFYGYTKSK